MRDAGAGAQRDDHQDDPVGPDRAGADPTGTDRAGTDRAGTDRAGTDRAGTGTDRAGIDRVVAAGERALVRGDAGEAVRLYREAVTSLQAMADREPARDRHRQALGGLRHRLGAALIAAERPDEAVPVLDRAVADHEGLPAGRFPEAAGRLADARLRRATAQALRGADASAVVDAQAALLAHRAQLPPDRNHPRYREFAGVLAVVGDVQACSGDPDLAVDCADVAIQIYREHGRPVDPAEGDRHRSGFLRAACVSAELHRANDQLRLARMGRKIITEVGGADPVRIDTVLLPRLNSPNRPDLTRSLGQAIEIWSHLTAGQARAEDDRLWELTSPVDGASWFVPADRGSPGLLALAARRLAPGLPALLAEHPEAALLIGVELNAWLVADAGTSEAGASDGLGGAEAPGPDADRPGPGTRDTAAWSRALLACAGGAERIGRPVLAQDLSGWAARWR